MIRYAVLGSGSSGNSYMIQEGEGAILFDAGFSLSQLRTRASQIGLDLDSVQGLCLTHLHPDHCRGAGVFARKTGKPVYIHSALGNGNYRELDKLGIPSQQIRIFDSLVPFTIGPFTITAFSTSHDSPSPVGFHASVSHRSFTILTDTGRLDETMSQFALMADVLFLEANFHQPMLDSGPYPIWLKKRIQGQYGHLSNEDAIMLLNSSKERKPGLVYFCHLSRTNNCPEVLETLCSKTLKWQGNRVVCAHGQVYYGEIFPGELCS